MQMSRFVVALASIAVAGLLAACGHSSSPAASDGGVAVQVQVLSNRADLLSGDDVLIDVTLPSSVDSHAVTMALNGNDVSGVFTPTASGALRGLVIGLAEGENTFSVQFPGGSANMTLINHHNGEAVISGPQLQPWTCPSSAKDALCNQPAAYSYVYVSTDPHKSGFQSYDPKNPPNDVATTTTDQGISVPLIVRVETGYEDRDQYRIAVLYQPGQDWSAAQPQAQFNHKLLITHGASCGVAYGSGSAPSVLSFFGTDAGVPTAALTDSVPYALGAGFAVMSTALDNSGHNCNVALQAESLMMAKEHLIENYGTLRYTIGTGCSGGSLAEQQIANAYPGIYQGILPTCSFPDAWSTASQFADYHLLLAYFGDPQRWAAGVQWPESDQAAIMDIPSTLNAYVSETAQFHVAVPTDPCYGTTAQNRYDATNNPTGVRCTITDAAINVLGQRPPEVWTAAETAAGHGFSALPVDNVGVQYGLGALQQGTITPDQFLDLNAKIGGLDVDTHPTVERTAASDAALTNAYRSGLIDETTNLDQVAIIDCRGPNPGLFHDAYRAFAVRARLDREHGTHANQLIWEGPVILIGDTACNQNSLLAMDRWLAAVEKDPGAMPLAQKLLADKPADLGDECWNGSGEKKSDELCPKSVVPIHGTPRMVAGDSITTDANKCQLKPLNRGDDYGSTPFSDAQWAQMQALFPDGVCDFSKPGVDQQPTIPWQTYQDSSDQVIYGGAPLPAAPAGSGTGWASPAFFGASS
jgi:hypothetical protein